MAYTINIAYDNVYITPVCTLGSFIIMKVTKNVIAIGRY